MGKRWRRRYDAATHTVIYDDDIFTFDGDEITGMIPPPKGGSITICWFDAEDQLVKRVEVVSTPLIEVRT